MTSDTGPSKDALLDALRSSERYLLDKLGALPEAAFEEGRYESGWNGRQILAHIASIEWTYPRLIDLAQAPPSAPASEQPTTRSTPTQPPSRASAPARGGIDSYNERQVAKRADASVAELLAEFQTNRAATIAAVESTDEALLTTPIRSAGGVEGTLASVINSVAVLHVIAHTNDIAGG